MSRKIKLNLAKYKLEELNNLLQEKCNDISINIKRREEDELILCLNYNGKCISSISILLLFDENSIEYDMSSNTKSDYGKRGFNKLLRAVTIIICKYINQSYEKIYVTSTAENPISAYLMINYFYGIPSASNRFTGESVILNNLIRSKERFTPMEDIEKFMKNSFPLNYQIETKVELNEQNIENAMNIFKNILNSPNFVFDDKKCIRIEKNTGGKKIKTLNKTKNKYRYTSKTRKGAIKTRKQKYKDEKNMR